MKVFQSPALICALVLAGTCRAVTAQTEDPLLMAQVPDAPVESTAEISGDRQTVDVQILSPVMDAALGEDSATVIIESPIGSRVDLRVNGVSVDPDQIGQLETNESTGIMRQLWYGVIFQEGDNTLKAIATLDGESATTEINVQGPSPVAALRLGTIEQRVPADGRSTVTVQGFLLDKNGNVANRGGRITLVPSSGEFVGVDISPDAAGFQVDARDGQFTATLQSSLDSGLVQIRADLLELEAFTQVQFETALRPSLMTGVIDLRIGAENTDYFGSFRDFLDPDSDGGSEVDLNGAAFATGTIGDWLLTAAVNYDRPLNETCETCTSRLYRADQQSEKPYPVYGDESIVTNVTPSQDQLYLRLEHSPGIIGADPDYVMWGDYSTGQEFATPSQEFSAFSRQLHGAKINYNLGDLQLSGLFSQGGESFQRDTILPDGTTGFYFLTQRLVVPGSEEIYFELEELERPGSVIRRDRLRRGTDYDIDYDRGSIVFVDPVLRTEIGLEGELLVRRVVVAYQHESASENKVYGGRVQYHFNREQDQKSWIGSTFFQEDKGDRDLQVYGIDAQFFLSEKYKFQAEYAHSNNDSSVLGNVSGSAYRLDFNGQFSDSITGRAYYRRADTEFANQSTVSFVPGQTRYGAALDARVSPTTQFRVRYDHEDNNGASIRPIISLGDLLAARDEGIPETLVDSSLTTVSAGVLQRLGKSNLTFDWIYRDRQDNFNPDNSSSSSQLRSRFTTPLTQNLRVSLTNETTLSAKTDAIYNDRTQASLDWRLLPGLNLALNQNWYTRGSLAGQSTTSVNLGGEYRLWKDAVFVGRYGVESFSTGLQDTAAFGVKQRWTVLPGLQIDTAYERVFGSLFVGADGGVGQGVSRAAQSRSGDSLSLRASYTDNPNFKAQMLYEYRTTNDSQTSNVAGSLLGKLSPSLTALFNFDRRFAAGVANRGLPASSNVRLGLAYRNPHSDRLNALFRYEYRRNPDTIPDSLFVGSGIGTKEHLVAGEAIYSPNWQWEFYTKAGFRHSTVDLADTFTARSTLGLAQFRARYQLNRRLDLTGGIRWIGQPTAGFNEVGLLGEVGFQATPGLRLAVGYSSGEVNNDRDFSGSRADGGVYFGAMLKLDNLFEGFGLQHPTGQAQVRRQLVEENPDPVDESTQAVAPQLLRLDVSQTIDFAPASAALSTEGRVVLDSLATVMQQYHDLTIDIQGVLPPLAELTPQNLDAQRLRVARQYLLSRGVTGDRLLIRSLGQAQTSEVAVAKPTSSVTFALNASAETFQLLSAQLGGGGLASSLIGRGLPDFATLPPQAPMVKSDRQTPSAAIASTNPETVPIRKPLFSFVPELNDADLSSDSHRVNLAFASVADQPEEPLAIALRANPATPEELISLLAETTTAHSSTQQLFTSTLDNPETRKTVTIIGDRPMVGDNSAGDTPIFGAQPLFTSLVNFANIQTSEFSFPMLPELSLLTTRDFKPVPPTDIALNATGENPLILSQVVTPNPPFALNSATPNARQTRRLESALDLLFNEDIAALNALLQATGNRPPEVRGQLVDLERMMQLNQLLKGAL